MGGATTESRKWKWKKRTREGGRGENQIKYCKRLKSRIHYHRKITSAYLHCSSLRPLRETERRIWRGEIISVHKNKLVSCCSCLPAPHPSLFLSLFSWSFAACKRSPALRAPDCGGWVTAQHSTQRLQCSTHTQCCYTAGLHYTPVSTREVWCSLYISLSNHF